MNWSIIKEDYPKSYKMLDMWISNTRGAMFSAKEIEGTELIIKTGDYISDNVYLPNRDLYDFFDEKGIYITIDPDFPDSENNVCFFVFMFQFIDGETIGIYNHESIFYQTRYEAESAAFENAFEILEDRLIKHTEN